MQQPPCSTVYSLTTPHSQSHTVPKGAPSRLLAIMVLEGSLELQADGSDFTILKHAFMAVQACQKYDFQGSGPIKAMVIDTPYMGFSAERLAMLAVLRGRPISLQHDRLAIMARLMEIALLCVHGERSGSSQSFLSGTLDLAIGLAADTGAHLDMHTSGPAMAFLLLAGKNIRRHHSVAYYAKALNVTPSHLNRTVRAVLGLTAKSCLDSLLLSEARLLLGDPGRNIAEISDILHFSHPAVFSRFFRRLAGTTPLCYRAGSQSTDR